MDLSNIGSIPEELDTLRNTVKGLGWLDEGSLEQAKAIEEALLPALDRLRVSIRLRFPEEF